MTSISRTTIFLIQKESDKIFMYRMSDGDFCCCSNCPFSDVPDWIRDYFMLQSCFNLELTITTSSNDYVNELIKKILKVIRGKYTEQVHADVLVLNRIKCIHLVRQVIPWKVCKKTQHKKNVRGCLLDMK